MAKPNRDYPPISVFLETLPLNWKRLTVYTILELIADVERGKHRSNANDSIDEEIFLYLGLDEFNILDVPCSTTYRFPSNKQPPTVLREIVESIGGMMCRPPRNTVFCSLLAGTYLLPLK